jgi:virginiamycin B lyase
MDTPNGIAVGPNEKIWVVDTSGNFFFSFDPDTEKFTKYVTSIPHEDSYGNLKLPTYSSNPYWIERLDEKLVMNEHNANRIAVFDPIKETMVEYTVPSRNTSWADCEGIEYCGVAQVFGFTVDDKKIWFTEWVENNIGVVDTSISLPFDIDLNRENIVLKRGETTEITLEFSSTDIAPHGHLVNISTTSLFADLIINPESTEFYSNDSDSESIIVQITASDSAVPDTHKVLLGAYNDEIAISKFITVTIE